MRILNSGKGRSIRGFLALTLVILLMITSSVFAEPQDAVTGEKHILIEGAGGEGSTLYILKFQAEGKLSVEKQYSGAYAKEDASYTVLDNTITIDTQDNSVMPEISELALVKAEDGTYKGTIAGHEAKMTDRNVAISWLHVVGILVVLILVNEVCRKNKIATIALFMIFPLVATIFWARSGMVTHLFRWVKLYSVVFAVVWFYFVRFTSLGKHKWAKWICSAILCVNILEACTQDFAMGYLPNVLNAIAGLLNIIVLSRWQEIGPDKTANKDMVWPGMTAFWIIAYDIWNWTFVYLNFPEHAAYHFMVLLACTIPAYFIKKGTWLQARAYTLAGWMMYLFTFQPFIDSVVLPLPRTNTLMLAAGILSIGANVIYALLHFRWKLTRKTPGKLNIGQNEIAY